MAVTECAFSLGFNNAPAPLPAALDCRGIGRLLRQIESRIKKTPASMARVFYIGRLGCRGDGASARLAVTLARRLF